MRAGDRSHAVVVDTVLEVDDEAIVVEVLHAEPRGPLGVVRLHGDKQELERLDDRLRLVQVQRADGDRVVAARAGQAQPAPPHGLHVLGPLIDQRHVVPRLREQSTDHTSDRARSDDAEPGFHGRLGYTRSLVSGILFDHIAIATRRIGCVSRWPPTVGYFGMSADVFRFGQWEFDGGGRIEVLEPRGDDGFLHRFLATRGPGVHHVTFKVPDLAETRARAKALGYGVVGYNASVPRWKEAFLHPKEALGIVVQIVEAPDEPPRGHWRKPPPMPADPPPPVRLLGLRLRAHSAEAARRQWATLLGGDASVEDGLHVFRWASSPLRIAVEIDATGEDGPTGIEVVPSARPLRDLGAPVPDLGTVFMDARADGRP